MKHLLLVLLFGITACVPALVRENSVSVKATIFGTSGTTDNERFVELLHNEVGTNNRLVELDTASPIYNLIELKLSVESSTGIEPFAEEFALLSLSSATGSVTARGDNWARNRIGDVALLRVKKDDINLNSVNFGGFATSNFFRRPGAHYLARIEDDDRQLPWKVLPESSSCSLLAREKTWYPSLTGEKDCFDLETLAGMILANLSVNVSEAVWDAEGSPIALDATNHRLFIVPHVTLEQDRVASIPGFGFIYQVDISGIGFYLTVQVPISFHFRNNVFIIDPLSPDEPDFKNADRIRIISYSLAADFALESLEATLRRAVRNVEMPHVSVGVINGETIETTLDVGLHLLVDSVAGPVPATRLTGRSSLIALPVQRTTFSRTTSNLVMFLQSLSRLERAPTGIIRVREIDNRIVIEKKIVNDQFNRERVITLSGMTTITPYNLHFLE